MFDFDSLREILATIRKNKMRTFLTGFAVAWGIFMLIVLLGSGNGLRNGILANLGNRAVNSVEISSGWTSMPYAGTPVGRYVKFDERDLDLLRENMPEIEHLYGVIRKYPSLHYENNSAELPLYITQPGYAIINGLTVAPGNGRFLNELDEKLRRKVIVIHEDHINVLFKGEDPLGKYVMVNSVAYLVVGVYKSSSRSMNPPAFIPLSIGQLLFGRYWGYEEIEFTVKGLDTVEANEAFVERLRKLMGAFHRFDPQDRSAMGVWNSAQSYIEFQQVFGLINVFILIIAVASLMAGIVGVGNIMLVTVKERTREIGIRKSLGAKPLSILKLVILEAIFITTAAGYAGILAGVGLTELVSSSLARNAGSDELTMFVDPTVDLGTVIGATVFLIACGVVAGLIPSYKATKISPIEAMRAD